MKVAENGGISPRGAYKKPARERAKRQIRCLIVDEGLSNQQISERLNIPLRTVERYVADIYTSDSQVIAGLRGDDEAAMQFSICKDRLDKQRQDIINNIASNPNAPFKDRVAAYHLACELTVVIPKMYVEVPAQLARRHALPDNNPLLGQGSNAVNLKLVSSNPLPYSTQQYQEEEEEK